MSVTMIDCGGADAIKLDVVEDHAHVTCLSASWQSDTGHVPAESCMVVIGVEAARAMIKALEPLAKQAVKAASEHKH